MPTEDPAVPPADAAPDPAPSAPAPSAPVKVDETETAAPDAAYFQRRAEEQLRLATRSDEPRVVQAHYALATAYLERIYGEGDNEDDPPQDDLAA